MNTRLFSAALLVLSLGVPAWAHRVDEYLQATMISVETDRIQVSMRMVPGIAVAAAVIASIDMNGDGVIADAEGQAYAERVLDNLSLTVDGTRVSPRLLASSFPTIDALRAGVGQISLAFMAPLPRSPAHRTLVFENHHQHHMAAYLVNCLVPRDRKIRIMAQIRNQDQSFYRLDFVQDGSL
jgi:hypothetical protein